MKKNIGTVDRVIRILAAVVIISLYFMNQISGTAAIILLAIAAIFIGTSFAKICLLYLPFGITTCAKK